MPGLPLSHSSCSVLGIWTRRFEVKLLILDVFLHLLFSNLFAFQSNGLPGFPVSCHNVTV